jgi:hypothetical protein
MPVQNEIERVVRDFIAAMCEWEKQAWSAGRALRREPESADAVHLARIAGDRIVEIYATYCSEALRQDEDVRRRSYQRPTEYDPDNESIIATVITGTERAQVVTERRATLGGGRYRYLLCKQGAQWRIVGLESMAGKRWEANQL